jgi:ubiquinone/menaquinone biosynthesis C-methylase UbiE
MSGAAGRILDVACGTGQNLLLFPPGGEITAIDLSPKMLETAGRNAARRGIQAKFAEMDAEKLDFPDASFDSVVSALSTCTFPDPIRALREMRRVCRPGGRILLLEHGHSRVAWLARLQDRNADRHYQSHMGCRWNQNPLELANAAGLHVRAARRAVLGIYHSIEATP